jgi:hypothetical protein
VGVAAALATTIVRAWRVYCIYCASRAKLIS